MKPMQVGWTLPATTQLESLHQFIAESNLSAADRQVAIVVAAASSLTEFPERGRPGRRRGTRELVVTGTPYIVAYRIRESVITILAVLHGARRWPTRFEE